MAGLCAARVLADRFAEVVVVERDELGPVPADRRAVPQGRHLHALLMAGARRLETWLPGLDGDLVDAGALLIDHGADIYWHQAGGERARFVSHEPHALCSRALLEHTVRRRVLAIENVVLHHAGVEGVVASADGANVTGVRLTGGDVISGDLVVDATGRACQSNKWLADLGYEPPPTSSVKIDMGYTTRSFRRRPDDTRDFRLALVIEDPPRMRMGVAAAVDGDRWMITLAGFHGDHAPTDLAGWLAFARSLPSPVIADIGEQCEPLGDAVTHRMPASLLRHVERRRRVPGGLVLVGDAVASFNPVYGQGMTSATGQAEALAAAVDDARRFDARFVRDYHRRAARAVATPWQLSVSADFTLPETTGPRPRGAVVMVRYVRQVLTAAHSDAVVSRAMLEVAQLVRPPASLFAPSIVRRVLRARRQRSFSSVRGAESAPLTLENAR
ncbi:MAG: FAD-dependent oxidoreductase [Acidimicrobiales bacterium]